MDPTTLIGPSSPLGYPAPYWFLLFFKVLGFTLHIVPMNLWYAGTILAMLISWRGGEHEKHLATRLMRQMPIIVAYGVNFGIIPLLFTQVAYYKVFYPSTILMAWAWLSIILLLMLAYYGVYIYAAGLRDGGTRMTRFKQVAGWVAALLFIVIGFLFANNFSLMTNLRAWAALWQTTSVAGAPMGTALNTADPTLWPRWLMMFGLAITTTATYIVVDTTFFARKGSPQRTDGAAPVTGEEQETYTRWATGFALKLYTVGIIWFAITGSWYVFGTWPAEQRQMMLSGSLTILTVLTAVGPGLPWFLIFVSWRRGVTQGLALGTGLAQFGVLTLNAISRQVVQNAELREFLDVTAEQVNVQWSPMILFLMLFVAGIGVIAWMISRLRLTARQSS
ncbi:MAG: hypothetical protein HY709_11280 [Candidatus Latescibacteria bacterium]|nr:hypothetical protein [Candidatus Latescibacterota bacterium]